MAKVSSARIREICDELKQVLKDCEARQQTEDIWKELYPRILNKGYTSEHSLKQAKDLEDRWLEDKGRTYRWLDGEDVSEG